MIRHLIVLLLVFMSVSFTSAAAVLPSSASMALQDKETYPPKPTEILQIQPVLIYPSSKEMLYQGRALFKDNKIVYIKLLQPKNYHPKTVKNQIINAELYPKEIHKKDIFFVKAFTNGQFSHNRLKLYRLPEFYAITIYKKDPFMA